MQRTDDTLETLREAYLRRRANGSARRGVPLEGTCWLKGPGPHGPGFRLRGTGYEGSSSPSAASFGAFKTPGGKQKSTTTPSVVMNASRWA